MPPIGPAKDKELLREMSFLEHLDDLRGVLVRSLVVYIVFLVVCWFFSERILNFLIDDLSVANLNFFAPAEAFMVRVKLSAVVALVVSAPYMLFLIWRFVAPALFSSERGKVYPLVVTSAALFYAGITFCYIVLIPIVLKFLLSFSTERLTPVISVSSYFAMVARLAFSFGVVFQLPIVVMILAMIGLVTPSALLRQWRWAVLGIFTASAVLTPPDAVSQVLMALPVLLLYIVSVLIAHVVVRRKKQN